MPHSETLTSPASPVACEAVLLGRRAWLLGVASLALAGGAWGADFPVSSAAELTSAMARARPGDRVVMADGIWRDQYLRFEGAGRKGAEIVLTARQPGKTILTGASRLDISGQWLEVRGLVFKGEALADGQHVVRFNGGKGPARHSRLTDSAIIDYNPPNPATRYAWVSIYGSDNRVDHNLFDGQRHSGPTVVVQHRPGLADRDIIERNYFRNRPPGKGNGFESIRIGTSAGSDSDSATVVRENLFENVDGELEIISVKSGNNEIRANTFRRSQGTITLRKGNNNQVIGNVFVGGGVSDTGGIRVMGENHVVADNRFDGITGRLGGAIVLYCGDTHDSDTANPPVRNVAVTNNQFSDVRSAAIKLDAGCDAKRDVVRPENVDLTENELAGGGEFAEGQAGATLRWDRNVISNGGGQLVAALPPSSLSPGMGQAAAPPIRQPRTGAVRDGRRAQARAQRPVAAPLTARDVGPAWLVR